MKTLEFKSVSDFHEQNGFPPPENPLFSVVNHSQDVNDTTQCEDNSDEEVKVVSDFYSITLKNIVSGEISYGRTKYDCENGTLLCTAPNQTLIFKGVVFSAEAYHICFHKDYFSGTPLFDKIKKYNYFNYNVNEALHLSPKEEELLKSIFRNIEAEYHNNQDEFSKELILSHLETMLKYIDRFYKRQFLNRQELNQELFTRFTTILDVYSEAGHLQEKGIPTVDWLAEQLGVSHRYMSDTIKAETGKTAVDQVNLYLIDEAKNMLLAPNASISETAYELGFEYPQYFSRLFKKKVGVSPKQFIEEHSMN
ncbi:MAG: helix-turn-helix transcriptional regulator [Flavobacteriales bacterium]|nr:helix-turn-helix transcriptional regulator [Flavobacteriales bacterium]